MLVQAGGVLDASANAGSPVWAGAALAAQGSSRAELSGSWHAPVAVVIVL